MAKMTKTMVDQQVRNEVFDKLFRHELDDFKRINDRQWGVLVNDANGEQRYVRVGVIVAELREDMSAQQLMWSEMQAYDDKQAAKKEKAKAKEAKIAKDKARRAKEKEEKEKDDPNQFLPSEVTV